MGLLSVSVDCHDCLNGSSTPHSLGQLWWNAYRRDEIWPARDISLGLPISSTENRQQLGDGDVQYDHTSTPHVTGLVCCQRPFVS